MKIIEARGLGLIILHNMKKLFIAIMLFVLIVASCTKKTESSEGKETDSKEIISSEKMGSLLIDVLLTESAVMTKQLQYNDAGYYTMKYYDYIFKSNGVTALQFKTSLDYYAANTEEFSKIMADVVDSLSLMQSEISNK